MVTLKGNNGIYTFDPDDRTYVREGGMGRVYKGLQTYKIINEKLVPLDEPLDVAIKVLFRTLTNNPNNIERAKIEASIRVDSNYLIRMIDYVEQNGIYHTISEWLNGRTLSVLIDEAKKNNRTIDQSEIKNIVKGVCNGLEQLHRSNIIHRDIDPTNIMVLDDRSYKSLLIARGVNPSDIIFLGGSNPILFDFGIVKMTAEVKKLTSAGKLIGKAHYAPPEQIRNIPGSINESTDIYALGITLYEMLTGNVPFDGTSEYAIQEKHIKSQLPFNIKVDKNYYIFLTKATAKRQEDRYKNVEQFRTGFSKLDIDSSKKWWKKKWFRMLTGCAFFFFLYFIYSGFIKPSEAVAYYRKGIANIEKGAYNDAILDFTKAIDMNPKSDSAYFMRGFIYLEYIPNYAKAERDYDEVINLNSVHQSALPLQNAYNNRGLARQYQGKGEDAINDYSEALQLNNDIEVTHLHRGNMYFSLKQFELAKKDFSEVLRLNANSIYADSIIRRINNILPQNFNIYTEYSLSSTNINVLKGDTIVISVSDSIVFDLNDFGKIKYGPTGFDYILFNDTRYKISDNIKKDVGYKYGELLCRVGEYANWFSVGTKGSFIASNSGKLQFMVNSTRYYYNSGKYNLEVRLCPYVVEKPSFS